MNNSAQARGFTLIEVVITVAIVAILAAVALPTYRDHMRKSRRAEAQAYLMAVASRQQQFLLDTRAYVTDVAAVGVAQPANVTAAYTVVIPPMDAGAPNFRVVAAPKTDQAAEKCGTLAIDHTGTKSAALGTCW